MKVQRRDFLKTGATAGALAASGGFQLNALAHAPDKVPRLGTEPGEWIPTTCQGCTTWCPVEVFVQSGRAVKVRGNQHSKQNDGTCCPRGHLALQQLYDPDRVKTPMKRTNPEKGRGVDPGFVPISWDEALDTVADRIMALREADQPHKYMLMRGRYTYMRDLLYDAMTKIIGSPNNISHSAICAEAEKFGSYFTEGLWDYRDYDLDKSRMVLIWGCDPLSSNRNVPAAIRRFSDLLDRGRVVVVDPRLHASAAKAHTWLPIVPGEDGALASALAHQILVKGGWNKEFVGDFADGKNRFKAGLSVDEAKFTEKHTHGLVRWWNFELKDKTPRWAAKRTGLERRQIEKVAKEMIEAAPHVAVWLGPGASMHIRGAYAAMAIHALNGLLGSVDREGGTMTYNKPSVRKMPGVGAYQDELAKTHAKYKKIDQRGTKEFPALKNGKPGGGVVTNNAADGILDEDPYPIEVAIGYMNNFPFSCSGTGRWEAAMKKIGFFVHLTTHASEMTQFADIVLPSRMSMFEKWAWLKGKQNRYGYASLMQPVVEPLWDLRADETEVPWLLAEKFAERGFDNLLRYLKEELRDPETGKSARDAAHFSEVATKWYTAPLWDGVEPPGGDHIDGWEAFRERGVWNSDAYPYKKRWDKFKTVTHKFEFYSETLKKALEAHAEKHDTTVDDVLETCKYEARGHLAFVPHYEAPLRLTDASYPLLFIDYKSRLNREGRSANAPWFQEFKKCDPGDVAWEDVLKMNPKDARESGIADGDTVKMTSTSGHWTLKVKLWEGIRPGTVAKAFGQGHWAYGRVAAESYKKATPRGVNNNEIIPAEYDRLSGSSARNGGLVGVRVEKA